MKRRGDSQTNSKTLKLSPQLSYHAPQCLGSTHSTCYNSRCCHHHRHCWPLHACCSHLPIETAESFMNCSDLGAFHGCFAHPPGEFSHNRHALYRSHPDSDNHNPFFHSSLKHLSSYNLSIGYIQKQKISQKKITPVIIILKV